MESSSGKATVTPTPRRNVRRGRCFFVMKLMAVLLGIEDSDCFILI